MKICLAQIKPVRGNIKENLNRHKRWIKIAKSEAVDFILFPELSLTAYEPKLAKKLAITPTDRLLDELEFLGNENQLCIGIGAPIITEGHIYIGQVFLRPNASRLLYCKQLLHEDELSYFEAGKEQLILEQENEKIAPAICYESLQTEHLKKAMELGASIYLASVAKAKSAVDKALHYFPDLARKYKLPVLMVNSIGFCDNFESAGHSSVWDNTGQLKAQLDAESEGLLIYDTLLNKAKTVRGSDLF
jgi:predicted amidohydrolase